MNANVYRQKEEVELCLLKSIDFSGMKPVALKSEALDTSCTIFKVYMAEGGNSVGMDNNGRYVVVPTTLQVGKHYVLDDERNSYLVDDLPRAVAAMRAMAAHNHTIYERQHGRGLRSSYGTEYEAWKRLTHPIGVEDLRGVFTVEAVDLVFADMEQKVEDHVELDNAKARLRAAEVRTNDEEWSVASEASYRNGRIEKSVLTFVEGTDIVAFTLDNGKLFSAVFKSKETADLYFKDRLPSNTSTLVSTLATMREDAEVVYTTMTPTGQVERHASLKNKGEHPMVDYCVSKSGRPAYLAAKKLFGGCTSAQLFDYEHMSGIKAKILEMQALKVVVEKAGNDLSLQVPINLVVPEKGSPRIRSTIGSLPPRTSHYSVFRTYLSNGLKPRSLLSAQQFLAMCEEIGYTKEQVYDTLRKLWQIEAV
jgi:hypothetical protein